MGETEKFKIAIVGLGYVGLPLAIEFGRILPVIGYDINEERIKKLQEGLDETLELTEIEILSAQYLSFSSNIKDLEKCNCFIITVPTPIDMNNRPSLDALINASKLVGKLLKPDDLVIYESTVYPGATEDDCVPVLEQYSSLKFNKDFYCGYSPERINPGDKKRRIKNIKKITSGSTPEITDLVDNLYNQIVTEGTHKVPSIKIAEMAKVIENTQRDLNIALINEIAMICNRLSIDTETVLQAAGSKWNFLPFRPGLVGGHCIGVDPYYLTHKAQEIGHHPELILAGRRINNSMSEYIASQMIKKMAKEHININSARVLVLGLTFKENCPDIRNTRIVDIIKELSIYNCMVDVFDPFVLPEVAMEEYGINMIRNPEIGVYDAIIIAVAHDAFRDSGFEKIREFGAKKCIVYDVKSLFPIENSDLRL